MFSKGQKQNKIQAKFKETEWKFILFDEKNAEF